LHYKHSYAIILSLHIAVLSVKRYIKNIAREGRVKAFILLPHSMEFHNTADLSQGLTAISIKDH